MASLYEILSLRKTSNAAQTENRLFVTKIIKPNGARVLSTVFVKTSEIVMISDTRSCLKIRATKISCVLDKGYNSHATFLNSDPQIFIRFPHSQDAWASIFVCLHGAGPISK